MGGEYKTLARRVRRHKKSLQYLSLKKLTNAALLSYEIRRRKIHLSSRPIFARINTCSVCNIACPGCAIYDDKMGIAEYIRPRALMTVATFESIIDSLKDSLLQVVLYDEGEPLLNKNIWSMVRYAKAKRIRTVISTNFSFEISDDFIEEMFASGLDYLIVALDGITQGTYEQHRQGGKVDLVKSNFERLINYRNRHKDQCKTEIEVQFLEFEYNMHEKDAVVAYAQQHQADIINCFLPYAEEISDTASLNGRPRRHFGCFDIYAIADFDVDGSLFSCDFQEDKGSDSVGNINDTPFSKLWNAPALTSLRESFAKHSSDDLHHICAECPITRGLPAVLR